MGFVHAIRTCINEGTRHCKRVDIHAKDDLRIRRVLGRDSGPQCSELIIRRTTLTDDP